MIGDNDYEAELKRRAYEMRGAQLPNQAGLGSALRGAPTPAAPLNEQIRATMQDVADAADAVAGRRMEATQATVELQKAEQRYGEMSVVLARLMEQHRAAGMVNGTKVNLA